MHFSYFVSYYSQLLEKNSELSSTDIRGLISDHWQGLNEMDKATFFKQEEAEKERYTEEMEEYSIVN